MSFLQNYALLTTGNESPQVYHHWAGLSALSSIVSRRVWIEQNVYTCYPNMYVLLVGSAGIKKSTAMNVARRLVRELKTIPIAPPSITKEALMQHMAEEDSPCKKNFKVGESLHHYTHISIFANELVTFLNAGGNPMGMIDMMTDIWDQPVFEVKTKNKGTDLIPGPYVTMLGCLTTETMGNLMNTKIISSGFSRRCMFVYSNDYGEPVPRPKVTPEMLEAWEACMARGKELLKVSGEFVWTSGADEWWDKWYRECHARKADEKDGMLQRYLQSKPEYVLKVAMLTTLSDTNDLILTPEKLELALAFIDQIEPNMTIAFEGTGRNELSPVAAAISTMILSSDKPITVKMIYRTFFKDAQTEEIDKILNHLASVDKIKRLTVTQGQITMQLVASPEAASKYTTTPPVSGQQ